MLPQGLPAVVEGSQPVERQQIVGELDGILQRRPVLHLKRVVAAAGEQLEDPFELFEGLFGPEVAGLIDYFLLLRLLDQVFEVQQVDIVEALGVGEVRLEGGCQ